MLSLKDTIANIDSSQNKYPHGAFRNSSELGNKIGTPFTALYMNDIYYALYHILDEMNIAPGRQTDNNDKSDFAMASHKKFTSRIWSPRVTYNQRDVIYKPCSSDLIPSNMHDLVTLVYISKTTGNTGNALPADFISDANWMFADAIQPQGSNLLDFSGHVGEIKMTSVQTPADIPKNWSQADGTQFTLPDNTEITKQNMENRMVISRDYAHVMQKGGNNTIAINKNVHSTTTDHTHTVRVVGDTYPHTLSEREMPRHKHIIYGDWGYDAPNEPGQPDGANHTSYNFNSWTSYTGGQRGSDFRTAATAAHTHGYDRTFGSSWASQFGIHSHSYSFDFDNMPAWVGLVFIQRMF